MSDFNDFLLYLEQHTSELQYDAMEKVRNTYEPGFTLSQEDVSFIVRLQMAQMASLLRQYHTWNSLRERGL